MTTTADWTKNSVASTTEPALLRRALVPLFVALVFVGGALAIGLRLGGPALVLWLAFALLVGAVLLFWEALRLIIDPKATGDESVAEAERSSLADLEARKHAAIRALKDIEFEHSIRRLSDDDYAMLRERYRAEARAAMEAMDRGLGTYLNRAEEMVAKAVGERAPGGSGTEARESDTSRKEACVPKAVGKQEGQASARACASCATANDADALFCKRCGTRLTEVA